MSGDRCVTLIVQFKMLCTCVRDCVHVGVFVYICVCSRKQLDRCWPALYHRCGGGSEPSCCDDLWITYVAGDDVIQKCILAFYTHTHTHC